MRKKELLKIINPILLMLMANQLATGFRPKLYGAGTFRLMHKQMALALSIALAAHFALNYPWVKNTYWRTKPNTANPTS